MVSSLFTDAIEFEFVAMDNGDENRRNSLASVIIESHFNLAEDKHDAEDLAWADSCLIKDTEFLENNWSSLKDALLEVLDNLPEPLDSSAAMDHDFPTGSDIEMHHSIEKPEAGNNLAELINKRAIADIMDDLPVENKTDFLSQAPEDDAVETFHRDPFLPTYSEDQSVELPVDSSLESLSVDDIESSTDDIFKVWDLNIPAEELDFVEPLKKALQEAKDPKIDPTFDEAEHQISIPVSDKDKSFDQIISGFADLSLNHDSI